MTRYTKIYKCGVRVKLHTAILNASRIIHKQKPNECCIPFIRITERQQGLTNVLDVFKSILNISFYFQYFISGCKTLGFQLWPDDGITS